MILIFSETLDITTDRVMEWLFSFGEYDILRINEGTPVLIKRLHLSAEPKIIISAKGREFSLDEVEAFWYRRGRLTFNIEPYTDIEDVECVGRIKKFHQDEWRIVRNYLIRKLEKKPHIGNFFRTLTNKLTNLEIAQSCGLCIPPTFISSYASEFKVQLESMGECICKPISEVLGFEHDGHAYETFTTTASPDAMVGNTVFCAPQLVQKRIEKWVELRVFIVNDKVFSMAIFSQNHDATSVDYRDRDAATKIRRVPFTLPEEIKEKLLLFMGKSGLNTGSIDMVLDKKGSYIFLEVNPVGVIDMVSTPCNYNIEKILAQQIIELMSNANQ